MVKFWKWRWKWWWARNRSQKTIKKITKKAVKAAKKVGSLTFLRTREGEAIEIWKISWRERKSRRGEEAKIRVDYLAATIGIAEEKRVGIQQMESKYVLMKNMFSVEEEGK